MKYLRNAGKLKRSRCDAEECNSRDDNEQPQKKVRKEYKQFPQMTSEPPIPPGEDEASNNRHQRMLLMEEKKVAPNIRTISLLMTRTVAFRRRDILQEPKPLKDILKVFPSLKRLALDASGPV